MSSKPIPDVACAIVGGGIHGTYLAQRLLDETPLDRSALCIVDPHDRLLASFRRKARRCGMTALRSSFVHHLGTEPFGLADFAEATDREDELVPTVDYPPRPTLDLFVSYAVRVIDSRGLETCHRQATVETIRDRGDRSRGSLPPTRLGGRNRSHRPRLGRVRSRS